MTTSTQHKISPNIDSFMEFFWEGICMAGADSYIWAQGATKSETGEGCVVISDDRKDPLDVSLIVTEEGVEFWKDQKHHTTALMGTADGSTKPSFLGMTCAIAAIGDGWVMPECPCCEQKKAR